MASCNCVNWQFDLTRLLLEFDGAGNHCACIVQDDRKVGRYATLDLPPTGRSTQ